MKNRYIDADGYLLDTAITTVSLPGLKGDAYPPKHIMDARSMHAINAALAARRPLLVRGEPGTGKSQLARAAAQLLGRAFIPHTVDARTDTHDLLYQVDHVARLAEAQLLGALKADRPDDPKIGSARDQVKMHKFVRPGPLWWAFDWDQAAERAPGDLHPTKPAKWSTGDGCVVLIDEIDKADATVPNGLLDALGHGRFAVPDQAKPVRMTGERPPLVVITTNEERALPDAFLRRCLVLTLALPEDNEALKTLLVSRGAAHFPDCDEKVLEAVAQQLLADRLDCEANDRSPPGTAEFIDLVRVLTTLRAGNPKAQLDLLKQVGEYALAKHPRTRRRRGAMRS